MTLHDILFTPGFDLVDIILSCIMGFIFAADLFTDGRSKKHDTRNNSR